MAQAEAEADVDAIVRREQGSSTEEELEELSRRHGDMGHVVRMTEQEKERLRLLQRCEG